jgi:hypothetical protein
MMQSGQELKTVVKIKTSNEDRQLAKAAEDLSIKQELLDLAAVCEEAADNIEDRMPGG